MPKPLNAVGLLLLGACAFLLWHLSSKITDLDQQVQDLEAAITDLQVRQGPAAAATTTAPAGLSESSGPGGKSAKAGKAGKAGKGRKTGGQGNRDRGAQMAEILATFSAEEGLDEDTTAGLEDALATLNEGVKSSRATSADGDPTAMREQRQVLFGEFESSVQSLLEPEQADNLLTQVKASRGGVGPPR